MKYEALIIWSMLEYITLSISIWERIYFNYKFLIKFSVIKSNKLPVIDLEMI